jgi:hypothetical protein
MFAANNDGMGGAALIRNPHTGGWNQTALNGDWFSWEDVVHNGESTMRGSNITSRVIHQGAEYGGTLTFVIPMANLSGQPFAVEDTNMVFAVWGMPNTVKAIQRAYLTTQYPF